LVRQLGTSPFFTPGRYCRSIGVGQHPPVYYGADLTSKFDAGLKRITLGVAPIKQTFLMLCGGRSTPLDISEDQHRDITVINTPSVVLLIGVESIAQEFQFCNVDYERRRFRTRHQTECDYPEIQLLWPGMLKMHGYFILCNIEHFAGAPGGTQGILDVLSSLQLHSILIRLVLRHRHKLLTEESRPSFLFCGILSNTRRLQAI
jgi:hypothetical protein